MKYKIGDIVKFINLDVDYRIGGEWEHVFKRNNKELTIGGSLIINKEYYNKYFAKIIDIQKDDYLVEYKDNSNKFVRLSFKENRFTLVKQYKQIIQIY